jgi:3-methylcrotonyl-CoA carboxylase alpha subunit
VVLAVYAQGERITVFAPQGVQVLQEIDALAHAGEGASPGGRLSAPMPGKVVSLLVRAGDAVQAGQPLAVMEAMKMEHTLTAPRNGVVAEVLYAAGDQVAEGAELLRLSA